MSDDTCVHFTGWDHPPCRAGIHYVAFTGAHGLPSRRSLPCFAGSHVQCERRRWPKWDAMPHNHPLSRTVESRE